jgi:hypothetical protein
MRTFRRGLSALAAAGLGVAGIGLAAGTALAAPAPAPAHTLPAVVSASGMGASATWAGNDTVKLTVGTPSSTTYAQVQLKPAPKNAPAAPPSFTTTSYAMGSPRWVMTFSDGCYIFGYPAQLGAGATATFTGPQWSVQGNSNCHPGGADVTYATALNDVSPAGSATVTGAYIVADGDQAAGTTDTLTAIQYGGEALSAYTAPVPPHHTAPPTSHWPGKGTVGNYVNIYGNGPDAYQQKYGTGDKVAGWTATQTDPAAVVIRIADTTKTYGYPDYQIEFQRNTGAQWVASGFCMSASSAGVVSEQQCSEGAAAQEWFLDSHGRLVNVAGAGPGNGFLTPHGTGAALSTSTSPNSGGGSGTTYRWKNENQLPK